MAKRRVRLEEWKKEEEGQGERGWRGKQKQGSEEWERNKPLAWC